jgi:hypothetical protein
VRTVDFQNLDSNSGLYEYEAGELTPNHDVRATCVYVYKEPYSLQIWGVYLLFNRTFCEAYTGGNIALCLRACGVIEACYLPCSPPTTHECGVQVDINDRSLSSYTVLRECFVLTQF